VSTNKLVASLAHRLSIERHVSVTYLVNATNTTEHVQGDAALTALRAAYVSTDRQLTAVRLRSAWPAPRTGDPTSRYEIKHSLAICRHFTVASGVVVVGVVVVVVVVGVCNRFQMRTSKCTCLIFGVSIGLDPG